ncbi:MAG: MBL fold metallo-hydrolase [Erysipelotrichaceae bacterium]|nr:MBL fold metallo-hydrolase [Erysipelotrichaceae bacterium]
MKITFFGTTTLLFDDGKDQILFDAHFTRPSLPEYIFGSKATDTAIAEEMMRKHPMDRLRAIFISHTHHDHVMDMPFVAEKTGAAVYGSSSAMNVARGGGIPEEQLKEFKAGETYEVGDYSVKVLTSLHSKPTVLNNDIGETIDAPLVQPARLRDYKEGGSYDFYVRNAGKTYLIRPSFNYIEGQLDGYEADVLFLGVAGLAKADEETEKKFFMETVEKVKPQVIIPLHWDNFFSPLDKPVIGMPKFVEHTETVFFRLAKYCEAHAISCLVQIPRTSIEL